MAGPESPVRPARLAAMGMVFATVAMVLCPNAVMSATGMTSVGSSFSSFRVTLAEEKPDDPPGSVLPDGPSMPSADQQNVVLDMAYLRWLWWPMILYLFWGMGYVCDVYFVRTIEVISERFEIPDDVAGATLMALGCNGPEMALNTIAIFHPSDIGIGAVVGGEVFNVLVIIGTAMLATPDDYLPLRLDVFSFMRDVTFYGVSVGLLYWVLHDGEVSRFNAIVLLIGAVVYSSTVALSAKLRLLCQSLWRCSQVKATRKAARRLSRATTKLTTRLSVSLRRKVQEEEDIDDSDIDMDGEQEEKAKVDPTKLRNWQRAMESTDPKQGSVMAVRVDMRNRLMDLRHEPEERFMWLQDDALIVSTALDPNFGLRSKLGRSASGKDGIVFDYADRSRLQRWHHGGLINQPSCYLKDQEALGGESPAAGDLPELVSGEVLTMDSLSRPLLNQPGGNGKTPKCAAANLPTMVDMLELRDTPVEIIPLEDILYVERRLGDKKHNEAICIHVHQHDDEIGKLITLELSSLEKPVLDSWLDLMRESLKAQRRTNTEAPPKKSFLGLLMEWAEWFQFPVKFWLRMTIPDMDKPELQNWYPMAFVMSMLWLSLFAYGVVASCDGIHQGFGISEALLGFTVAAAGTSFPNVFSGMVVARQGKTSMAIANALGANVQNVFLALAVPWTIQSCFINHGPFKVTVQHLTPAIIECGITMIPVLGVFICYGGSMPKWSGGLFLLTYFVYLVFALEQQLTNCAVWPFPCKR